jgi:hypothetical protein
MAKSLRAGGCGAPDSGGENALVVVKQVPREAEEHARALEVQPPHAGYQLGLARGHRRRS